MTIHTNRPPMTAWQSACLAPEDIPVLIWDGRMMCVAVRFKVGRSCYWRGVGTTGYDLEDEFETPTHFQLLPQPPPGP